jgi:cytochrome P450
VDELISHGKRKGHMEFITDFALPLPAMVIAELLGVPPEDRDTFHGWSNAVIATLDVGTTERAFQQRMEAELALGQYFRDLIRRRRQEPREDLINALIRARDDQDRLTEEDMCMLLLVAGHETTVNLLGNGLFTLLSHPAQLGQLMDNPQLLSSAIEEMLRFECPVQRALFRLAAETFTVGTTVIERGQQVSAIIGAANRDPDQFAKPDKFDITRQPNRHLAFGRGIHYCLGAPLARLEAEIAFTRLFELLPDLQLVDQAPEWNSHTVFRGFKKLPVTF